MFSYEEVKQRYNLTAVKMSGTEPQIINGNVMPPIWIFDISISPRFQQIDLAETVKLPQPTGEAIVITLGDVPVFGTWVKLPAATEVPFEDLQAAAVQEVALTLLAVCDGRPLPESGKPIGSALLPRLSSDTQAPFQVVPLMVLVAKEDLTGSEGLNALLAQDEAFLELGGLRASKEMVRESKRLRQAVQDLQAKHVELRTRILDFHGKVARWQN